MAPPLDFKAEVGRGLSQNSPYLIAWKLSIILQPYPGRVTQGSHAVALVLKIPPNGNVADPGELRNRQGFLAQMRNIPPTLRLYLR